MVVKTHLVTLLVFSYILPRPILLKVHLEGVNRCSANLMTNNAELKFFTLTKLITSDI